MQKTRPAILNNFVGGLFSDNDPNFQPQGTYRDSVNGRILYNKDGGYAWVNDNGNLLSFTLKNYRGIELTGYIPIGWVKFEDKVVIFSTDGTNSEIGFVKFDTNGIGTYTQAYNDLYDPNSELLNFSKENSIVGVAVRENVDKEMVYWNDGVNEDSNERRCINILRGADFSYSPLGLTGKYPFHYSANSFLRYCSWEMGNIKFDRRIDGQLKTGVYQYTYRQRTLDGYATPWYPLTTHIFMTDKAIDMTDSNEYQMTASNQVTPYGIRLIITGMDNRFPILEVAYAYSITENQTVEAGVFHTEVFTSAPAASQTIDHVSHTADPLTLEELNLQYFPARKAKGIAEKDNYLFEINVNEVGVLAPDLSDFTITPYVRIINGDDESLTAKCAPFVSTTPVSTSFTKENYTGNFTAYTIDNDYFNYKGMQVEHSLKGYWRGETYRFGVLLYDAKGMPNYVFFAQDYTFPEQYDASGDFTLTQEISGDYKLNILGAKMSGIRIPAALVYDEKGKINLSGFSIVRAKRVKKAQWQGVFLNTVFENDNATENSVARWQYTRPLPFTSNRFYGNPTGGTGADINNALVYSSIEARDSKEFANRATTFLIHSPEILFGYPPPVWADNDTIHLVGMAADINNSLGYIKIGKEDCSGYYDAVCHYYSKNYNTDFTKASQKDSTVGDKSYIQKDMIYLTTLSDVEKYIEDYDYQNSDLIYTQWDDIGASNFQDINCDCSDRKKSWGMPGSLLVLLKDIKNARATYVDGDNVYENNVFIANFEKPITEYYGGTEANALEKTRYISTGHFQPINAAVIADVVQGNGDLLFNDVEVWGGDTFVHFFDFTRLLPQYSGDCSTASDCYADYSVSMVVPLESNLNYALRNGRQFAKDGVEFEPTACGASTDYSTGIQEKQREDFNINSVLQHEEQLQFFFPKPSEIVNRTENPMTVIHSELKYYGEPIDSYRRNLANNQLDLKGSCGDGTALFPLYSYIYYLQERGFGRLYINQPATLSSPEQGTILVGSGGILTGALYITEEAGCQHKMSPIVTDKACYWVDSNMSKHYRFTQNGLSPISDLHGQHNNFYEFCKFYRDELNRFDAPAGRGGIYGVFDYKNNQVITTFRRINTSISSYDVITDRNLNFVIVYDENIDGYVTRYEQYPKFYFNFKGRYFTIDNNNPNKVYVELAGDKGNYYGVLKTSELETVLTVTPDAEKIFDVNMVNVNADGVDVLSQADFDTETNSISLSLLTDTRVRYKHGYLMFPIRGETEVQRVRGKALTSRYTVTNADNKLCQIATIETKFRITYNN